MRISSLDGKCHVNVGRLLGLASGGNPGTRFRLAQVHMVVVWVRLCVCCDALRKYSKRKSPLAGFNTEGFVAVTVEI